MHQAYMSLALQLAEHGRYSVSPNPMVGCILVKDEQIIGQGFHQYAGGPHAEVIALSQAQELAKDATAYVTLEPCCHVGRTPPCTDALLQAGIKKVYIACQDPNPLVAGKGIAALQQAGIEVEVGLCADAAKELNKIFFHYITKKRPFVISKWAMSLDGKTITAADDSKQISNLATQQHCHQLRQQVDAILVGANTIRTDNPQLTVRITDEQAKKNNLDKQPLRIILTTEGSLPLTAKVFSPELPGGALIVSTQPLKNLPSSLDNLVLPTAQNGKISISMLLTELGNRKITSLFVEGGMQTHYAFLNENLVDQIYVYLAPVIIGDFTKKQTFSALQYFTLDNNLCLSVQPADGGDID